MSLRKVVTIQTSLSLIDACTFYAEAFFRGKIDAFQQAEQQLDTAISSTSRLGDYQLEWIVRTLQKVTAKMWEDSPWIRLGDVIPRRMYLRKLVEDGIVTLWSSQIAALEVKSKLGSLNGGYLDDQIKRVVVHMPTSAGKTLLAQLAIAHQSFTGKGKKCVYVGPSRALCDQVAADLAKRLARFGIRVTALASDNELLDDRYESLLFGQSTVIAVTPEKLSHLLRQRSSSIQQTSLFIFDELHNIGRTDRGWIYEELISLLLQHPSTRDAKMLFLSAVMPNHLMVQEWVDPKQLSETINTAWQPTRTLKGVVRFSLERPRDHQREIILPGDLIYVRRKEDVNSPLRIRNFIQSKQVGEQTPEYRWKRISQESDNEISHTASAATRFARLGPVLVYCPKREDTANLCKLLVQMPDHQPPSWREGEEVQYREIIEFVKERLSDEHPLVEALRHRVAFHHGKLPRDVRNEIEFAFQEGWIRIMTSTTTLAEGVNFPIKTLLLSDYCQRHLVTKGDRNRKEWVKQHPLSKSDFQNIVGRAGRALYETEGLVVFMQSIVGYPKPLDRGFEDYLDLEATSSELHIKSTLADDHILTSLSSLVEAVDNGTLTEEQLLFGTRSSHSDEERDVAKIVDKLQTFTLLLQDQELVGEDEESFIHIFQGTFLGKQRPDVAPQILGPFSHRSAKAIRSQLTSVERSLFAQTGLKISTCRLLMQRVHNYWEQKSKTLDTFLNQPLDELLLYEIAAIIYNLEDAEVDPKPVQCSPRKTQRIDDARFFAQWIHLDSLDWPYQQHFGFIRDSSWRAQAYTDYTHDALEYKASWTLSAFWLFSKALVEEHYGKVLMDTSLGRELILLPAYAKFGVNTPAAALFSTLGISPSQLARKLGDLYEELYSNPEGKFDYPKMLQWLLSTHDLDLEKHHVSPSHIRRLRRLLESFRPLDNENNVQENEQTWEVNFWIAGWQYCNGESVIDSLRKGSSLLLRHEQNNRYDPNAIEVLTENNVKLGYVPRYLAKEVADQVDMRTVKAIVSKVRPSTTPQERVFVHCWTEER